MASKSKSKSNHEFDATSISVVDGSTITLRPYQASDVEQFMEWASDEDVIRYSRIRRYASREDALNYLKECVLPHPWFRAICLDGRPVGFVCFAREPGDRGFKGLLSYALGSNCSGRGIMTEVVRSVVSTLLVDVERVEAFVQAENKASIRVLEKAGFKMEGVLRNYAKINGKVGDVVMYSRIPTDTINVT